MRKIDTLVVHCTATRAGCEYSLETVRSWHVKGNGWRDIGYHFLIHLDGTVDRGRPVEQVGAHCAGHNATSIGICYVGGIDATGRYADTRTPRQRDALRKLLTELALLHPGVRICGHRDLTHNKLCPCFDAEAEYADIRY